MITVLKSKIHMATVTDSSVKCSGSIGIDEKLLKAAGISEYEKVLVANASNGERFETYAVKAGKEEIRVMGAAAKLAGNGDKVIIMSFELLEKGKKIKPRVIYVDGKNKLRKGSQ